MHMFEEIVHTWNHASDTAGELLIQTEKQFNWLWINMVF